MKKELESLDLSLLEDDEDIFAPDEDETMETVTEAIDNDDESDFDENDDQEENEAEEEEIQEEDSETESAPADTAVQKKSKGKTSKKPEPPKQYGIEGTQELIRQHLDELAAKDPQFAKRYVNPKKSLAECCKYICGWVFERSRKGGMSSAMISSDEIFGQAVHYYIEDDVKPADIPHSFAVTAEGHELLTEQEKADLQKQAEEEARKTFVKEATDKAVKEFRDGKRQVDISDEEEKAVRKAAREDLMRQEQERLKVNSSRKAAKAAADSKNVQEATLFGF